MTLEVAENPDVRFMRRAMMLAARAQEQGEVPVGAVVVYQGKVVGQGWNQTITLNDPTAHAEMIALRQAGTALDNYRLVGCTLYVSLEPCPMCLGACVHSRLDAVVFGAADPKTGAAGGNFNLLEATHHNHRLEVMGGVLAKESGGLLRSFFRSRR